MATANTPGQRGSYEGNENKENQPGGTSSSWQDPRTIIVKRTPEGNFGFVLRHFIVYPPESQDAERGDVATEDLHSSKRSRLSQQDPMDTIFVMHVKDGGPANVAGLQEGDRILSVNGQSIAGQSYAQVIGLIQASDAHLRLLVVPRNEDILQVAYQSSAYNQGLDVFRGSASNIPHPPDQAVVAPPQNKLQEVQMRKQSTSRFRSEVRFSSIDKDVDDEEMVEAQLEPQCFSTAPTLALPSGSISSYESMDSQLSPAYLENSGDSGKIYTSSVTWPRRGSRPEDMTYRSVVSNGPPAPVRTSSKNISLSHLQRFDAKSGSLESISKSSKSSSDSSGSRMADMLRRQDSNDNLSQDTLPVPQSRDNRWSAPGEKTSILQYKESLRKSQEDLFGASRSIKPSGTVLSKSVTTGQLQVAQVSSAPTSPSRPNIPYTKSHTTSSLLNRNKYFEIQADGAGLYEKEGIQVTAAAPTTQTYSTTTYVTSTGSNAVATTSVTINPTPIGIRYLPAYSGRMPEPVTKPQIIIRRRKSYDNVLDDGPHGKGALRKIHDNLRSDSSLLPRQHRIPVKHQDTSPSHVMKIEKVHGAGGLSVTVKRTPVQDTQGGPTIVSQRLRQFEVGSYESLPSPANAKHQFELRKLETSAQIDSVAQKAAKFDSYKNGEQPENSGGNKKISIHIRNKFDSVRQPYESATLPSPHRPFIYQQEPPPKTPSVNLHTDAPKFMMGTSFETSKRITVGAGWGDNKSKSTSFLVDDRSYTDGGQVSCVRPQQSYSVLHSNQERTKFARQSSEERSPHLYTQNEMSMFTSSQSMCNMSNSSTSSSLISPNIPRVEHDPTSPERSPPSLETGLGTVTFRSKPKVSEEDNDVKLFRRISYLKATAKDRGHLSLPVNEPNVEAGEDGADVNLADQPTTPTKTSIRKLKSFFGERSPKIIEATERRPQFADLPSPPGEVTKEGVLTCKLALVDRRRASDRSWKQNWCVVCDHSLYLCKEKKESQLGTQVTSDDLPVSLKGSTVDIAHSYTKKKHVFRLCTQTNCEYLLQADDHESMMSWIHAMQAACTQNQEEEQKVKSQSHLIVKKSNQYDHPMSQKMSPLVAQKSTVKKIAALSFRARSPGHSPGIRPRKDESPKVKEIKEVKTWKGKVVKSFKRLGSASDTLALAHHEADLDETEEDVRQTFGVPLSICPPSTFNEFIPLVIELCITIIEVKGLECTGIYRIPGNSATVNMLQDELNRGLDQLDVENDKWLDVNAVGSLLKSFLRQLPEPLITYELYHVFIQANRNDNPEKRMLTLKRLIHELPETHFETFKFIATHLNNVANHGAFNKMDAKNLAIVFGPTLIRNVSEDRVAMVADMSDQCRIIESIITHNDWFFSSWDVDNEIPLDKGGDDHPPSASTQTMVADEDGLNLKELVANIVQAANRKLQERDAREAANGGPQTSFTLFGERNIDEEVSKRKYQERNIDEEVSKRKETISTETTSSVTTTTTTTESTNRKSEISTREGIFTAKMVFLQGRQASDSSLRADSEDVLSDPGLVSSQSTQSFQSRFGRFQNPALPGYLGLGDNQFSRRHSEEIVLDRRPSPDNRTSTSSFESAVSVQEQRRQKEMMRLRKSESEGAETEKRRLDKQWVEKELRKTREELEEDEDCLEDFIGNTNKISRKISDFTSRMDSGSLGDTRSVTSDYSTMSSTKEVPPISSLSDYSSNASPTANSDRKPILPIPVDKNRSHSLTNLNNSSQSVDSNIKGGKFFAVKIKPVKQESDGADKNTQKTSGDSSESSAVQQSSRKGRSVNFKVGGDDMSPEDKCTLSRTGSLRRGSLDSLRDFYEKNEYTASFASSSSEDGSDLLTSLTTTFDQKLRILLDPKYKLDISGAGLLGSAKHEEIAQRLKDVNSNSVNVAVEERGNGQKPGFRDPSLHRYSSDSKVGIASRFERPELELPESALHKQQREIPPEGRKTRMGKVKAFVSKMDKPDSFAKSHETPLGETSLGATSVISDRGDPSVVAAKCKSASPPVRRRNAASLRKRRHTVGGIRDFEDVMTMIREQAPKPVRKTSTSAWDRLQPGGKPGSLVTQERTVQSWIQQERLRSSSSDVSQTSSDGRGGKKSDSSV